ncbi:MAG: M24 family metallopeptidase [Hyphomonadaceae bacterium]
MFAPAWDQSKQPDQWKAVADIISQRNPAKIAINTSDLYQFGDGMTLSQYEKFVAALPAPLHARIVSGEALAIRWLETRTPAEMEIYPTLMRMAHRVIGEAFSRSVITPGVTTAEQVQWWYRDRLLQLGLDPWFHPSVGIQRKGAKGMLEGDEVILPGDLLWTDFGITYLRLNTDMQHLAYVLKPGESKAPEGLRQGLANSNRGRICSPAISPLGAVGTRCWRLPEPKRLRPVLMRRFTRTRLACMVTAQVPQLDFGTIRRLIHAAAA